MFAIESEKKSTAGFLPVDQPMFSEPVQRVKNPAVRGAIHQASDLSAGDRPGRSARTLKAPLSRAGQTAVYGRAEWPMLCT